VHTAEIRQAIAEGVKVEEESGNLAQVFMSLATMRGVKLSKSQTDELVGFVRHYVELVPTLLEQVRSAAAKAGVGSSVAPIIEVAEQYFLAREDLMPDRLGLLGLMDDAYLANSLMEDVASRYRKHKGGTVWPAEMSNANAAMRAMIGEPQVSALDAIRTNALQGHGIQQAMQDLVAPGPVLNFPRFDTSYGGCTLDEYVNIQMGAMGIL